MLPKFITELIELDDKGKELYKKYLSTFVLVDKYLDELEGKDLLDEYQLKDIEQKLGGAYGKLYIVADTAGTIKSNFEDNYFDKEVEKLNQINVKVNVSEIKGQAKARTTKYRTIRNTFMRYATACDRNIIVCQSILKKLTNEKGFKRVDHVGESQPGGY